MSYLIKTKLKSMISFKNSSEKSFNEKLVEENVDESVLKSIPKSDFIYNSELLTLSYLESISNEEKNKLVSSLQKENMDVRKENEQFRQKNFEMYLQLRKFKAANQG